MKTIVPDLMKAVFINPDTKKPEVKTIEVPKPGKGEVLIKIHTAAINPSDLARINELQPEEAQGFIAGNEGYGEVVACGKGILPVFLKGKRVACASRNQNQGTWAEYMVTQSGSCFPVNKRIPEEQAAMFIINPMTAMALAEIAIKGKHKCVVVSAASGAVGKMLNLMLEKAGIVVINIVNSEKKMNLNYKYMLNSEAVDFKNQFNEMCIQLKPKLMFDAVGGHLINEIIEILPENSEIVIYGNLSKQKIEFLPPVLVRRSKRISGFFLGNYTKEKGLIKTLINLIKINKLLKSGMAVSVQNIFSIDEINQAIEVYEKNMSKGKVIIKF